MPDAFVTRDQSVTTITLNRSAAMNAFDASMAATVADAVQAAGEDASCREALTGEMEQQLALFEAEETRKAVLAFLERR